MQPAVFLDRDNTIIDNSDHLGDPDGVVLFDRTVESLQRLDAAGFALVIVTNQSGVARGLFTENDVHAVHECIRLQVQEAAGGHDLLTHWYHSPYHPEGVVEPFIEDHPSRKPEPGMLLQAAAELGLDLSASWMIGDAPRDIRAGQRAGCRTILLRCGGFSSMKDPQPDGIVDGIGEAADIVLSQ